MKMKKNCIVFSILWVLVFGLAACGSSPDETVPVAAQDVPATPTKNIEPLPTMFVEEPTVTTTEAIEVIVEETAVPPTPIIEVLPPMNVAHSSGDNETIVLLGCFDFDNGVSLTPPDPNCDFTLLPGPDNGTIEMYPIVPAQLAYGGVFPDAPTFTQCAGTNAFSTEPELVAPMAAMYVCFRTGEGRIGYLHFTTADLEQAYSVTFDWLVFDQDDGHMDPAADLDFNYQNETFGIQLTFPESWSGVEVSQNSNADATNICFTFIGSASVCVLQINVYGKAAWSNLEEIPDGYYLGENDEFVLAAGPYDSECVQLDEFQCARYQEIPAVLSTLVIE